MNDNPYQTGAVSKVVPKTRPTRWLVWSGLGMLLLASFCVLAALASMIWAFETVASSTSAPSPADLAQGIGYANYPMAAAFALFLLGLLLILVGMLRRQPVPES